MNVCYRPLKGTGMDETKSFIVEPIGVIRSCFTEKFGIPRQPGLVKQAHASLEFFKPFNREEMVRGLENFSHLWVHFLFHETVVEGWKPTVRPPWLGGKKRVGVFATRSPHRPNHIGLSVVRLENIQINKRQPVLELSGIDFLDQTPVIDIKPYIPYSDKIESARVGYANWKVPESQVLFTDQAKLFCESYQKNTGRNLEPLIVEVIQHDPRPASQKQRRPEFGMMLWDVNVRWRVELDNSFLVESCELLGKA